MKLEEQRMSESFSCFTSAGGSALVMGIELGGGWGGTILLVEYLGLIDGPGFTALSSQFSQQVEDAGYVLADFSRAQVKPDLWVAPAMPGVRQHDEMSVALVGNETQYPVMANYCRMMMGLGHKRVAFLADEYSLAWQWLKKCAVRRNQLAA